MASKDTDTPMADAWSRPGTRTLGLLVAVAALTGYVVVFLAAEGQMQIGGLLVLAGAVVVGAHRAGLGERLAQDARDQETLLGVVGILACLVVGWVFRADHFALLMLSKTLLFMTACLGVNVQLGYTGVLNFAGASFFGVGCYTAAVLGAGTAVPPLLSLLIGGVCAALVGSILIVPVLRTKGHYAAVVTIAFAVLFTSFLQVNDVLGGPQGLRVAGMSIAGWDFNRQLAFGPVTGSFYLNYYLLALVITLAAIALNRRIERSWIGLAMDAVRLDELAAGCFGVRPAVWKIVGFTLGNFVIGVAGALFGMMIGFVAPTNFTFADSLIILSIVLLGGMGSIWGIAVASFIVILLPEKLQAIQEYRFLLFAALVILVLRFRPNGLLPRAPRSYFPGWRP